MVPRSPLLLLAFLCSLVAQGAELACGTPEQAAVRVASFPALSLASTTPTILRYDDGVFVMQANERITPNANRMDLLGQTLRAEPLPDERFRITRAPLAARPVTGNPTAVMKLGTSGWHYRQQELPFSFPLGQKTYRTAYISALGGIYFERPPVPPQDQYSQAAVLAPPIPLVAPLLIGRTPRWAETHVRVREEGNDSVAVTWTFVGKAPNGEVPFAGEVQAVLYQSGAIEFSYLSFSRFVGGSAVITTGTEAVREQRATLARVTDPSGDGTGADIRALEVARIDALDQFEIRIELVSDVAIPLNARVLIRGKSKYFDQEFRGAAAPSIAHPAWATALPVIVRSGSTMRILMYEGHLLPPDTLSVEVTLYDDARTKLDVASIASFDLPAVSRMPFVDLSSVSTAPIPIAEAFTIPGVAIGEVWGALAREYRLSPDDVEAVMVFTSFPEYLEYWASSSTNPGNAGVDGLGTGYSSDESPRYPAFIDLGSAEQPGEMLHELGHRWLFYPMLKEGQNRVPFNNYGHLPSNADSTAALVAGQSPMGGVPLVDRGNNKYDIVCGEKGFTWLELYLMGLAAPSEVTPMLQITQGRVDSHCGGTAEAQQIRKVTIEQVIEGTRPRHPSYAKSPKVFPIAFVLIDDPSTSMIPDAVTRVRSHAALLMREFATATGGRGKVTFATGRKTRRHPSDN